MISRMSYSRAQKGKHSCFSQEITSGFALISLILIITECAKDGSFYGLSSEVRDQKSCVYPMFVMRVTRHACHAPTNDSTVTGFNQVNGSGQPRR